MLFLLAPTPTSIVAQLSSSLSQRIVMSSTKHATWCKIPDTVYIPDTPLPMHQRGSCPHPSRHAHPAYLNCCVPHAQQATVRAASCSAPSRIFHKLYCHVLQNCTAMYCLYRRCQRTARRGTRRDGRSTTACWGPCWAGCWRCCPPSGVCARAHD